MNSNVFTDSDYSDHSIAKRSTSWISNNVSKYTTQQVSIPYITTTSTPPLNIFNEL